MPSDDKVVALYPDPNGKPGRPGLGELPVSCDAILDEAKDQLDEVVLFGVDKNGLPYLANSNGPYRAIALLELCKAELLDMMRVERGWLDDGDG